MKKTITLIIFYTWTLTTFSQNYYSLIEENRSWNVLSVEYVGPSFWDTTYSTITYQFFGDTIIDAKTYSKLYESNQENPSDWNLCCFMREDNDKNIWLKNNSGDDETLMYDFSAQTGDTVFVGNGEPVHLYIDSITETEINQTIRKKYWLSCVELPSYKETWIEGIGSNRGICWSGSANLVGGWFRLLCTSDNGVLIYNNPNYETCYLITGVNGIDDVKIQVYPNPATGQIMIESNIDSKIESITLTNLNGKEIMQFNPQKPQLNVVGISSGLYILKISFEKRELIRKVIIE